MFFPMEDRDIRVIYTEGFIRLYIDAVDRTKVERV